MFDTLFEWKSCSAHGLGIIAFYECTLLTFMGSFAPKTLVNKITFDAMLGELKLYDGHFKPLVCFRTSMKLWEE